jgi:hypothetical protein
MSNQQITSLGAAQLGLLNNPTPEPIIKEIYTNGKNLPAKH